MGNCLDLMSSSSQEKIRVCTDTEVRAELAASTCVKKTMSSTHIGFKGVHRAKPNTALPVDVVLKPEQLYYLMPQLRQPCSPPGSDKKRSVKVVVTKQQLELLLTSARKNQSFGHSVIVVGKVGVRKVCRKWRPSLAAIQELQDL